MSDPMTLFRQIHDYSCGYIGCEKHVDLSLISELATEGHRFLLKQVRENTKDRERIDEMVERAVLAERERCANIANSVATDVRNSGEQRITASKICAAILSHSQALPVSKPKATKDETA